MSSAHAFGHQLECTSIQNSTPIVFLIDEDTPVRGSLALSIRSEGWQAETFASSHDFLARLRTFVPNCDPLLRTRNARNAEAHRPGAP